MRIKRWLIISSLPFLLFLSFLLMFLLISSDSDSSFEPPNVIGVSLSEDVLKHRPMVEKYAKKYDVEDYINYLLAIMMVESGGKGKDVMQSSESAGLPVNTLDTEESIEQGCKYFSRLLNGIKQRGIEDINVAVQSYNFGGGYTEYIARTEEKKHTFEHAVEFAKEKSNGKKVDYKNEISISTNGGWRYAYGNMFYVELVSQYLAVTEFDDKAVQELMNEALKYEGWPYVYGGSNPNTSFDCSGLTQWCYGKIGIKLPRTAQMQYDSELVQHIPYEEAKAGDLIFFHSTYDISDYVTHIGIYVGNGKMYHAGDPIGYEHLGKYWQEHMICAGRIKTADSEKK